MLSFGCPRTQSRRSADWCNFLQTKDISMFHNRKVMSRRQIISWQVNRMIWQALLVRLAKRVEPKCRPRSQTNFSCGDTNFPCGFETIFSSSYLMIELTDVWLFPRKELNELWHVPCQLVKGGESLVKEIEHSATRSGRSRGGNKKPWHVSCQLWSHRTGFTMSNSSTNMEAKQALTISLCSNVRGGLAKL
jgi:hypothetical protein